jgi:hypothetical protein
VHCPPRLWEKCRPRGRSHPVMLSGIAPPALRHRQHSASSKASRWPRTGRRSLRHNPFHSAPFRSGNDEVSDAAFRPRATARVRDPGDRHSHDTRCHRRAGTAVIPLTEYDNPTPDLTKAGASIQFTATGSAPHQTLLPVCGQPFLKYTFKLKAYLQNTTTVSWVRRT